MANNQPRQTSEIISFLVQCADQLSEDEAAAAFLAGPEGVMTEADFRIMYRRYAIFSKAARRTQNLSGNSFWDPNQQVLTVGRTLVTLIFDGQSFHRHGRRLQLDWLPVNEEVELRQSLLQERPDLASFLDKTICDHQIGDARDFFMTLPGADWIANGVVIRLEFDTATFESDYLECGHLPFFGLITGDHIVSAMGDNQ